MYQHILLAVDFSEHGNHVIRKARRLAGIFRAKLSIIHVLDNIPLPDTPYGTVIPLEEYGTMIPLDEGSRDELLEAEKSKLKQIGDELGVSPANRWMVWGVPGAEIVRIAQQENIDLIILGSHGRRGLAVLLGSTASSVLHKAGCDVVAVRLQD